MVCFWMGFFGAQISDLTGGFRYWDGNPHVGCNRGKNEGLDWDLIGRLKMGTMSSWTGDERLHPGARGSIERHMSIFT